MFAPPAMGYDRAITVFSPDGRLFQVEYALEAVRRGWTTLGVRCPEGIVLSVEKRRIIPLVDPPSMEKIWKIDEHVGIAYAGLASDGRVLIDRARIEAQINRLLYDEPIDIEVLTRRLSDIKQIYTQHAGVRPFGTSFLIAGVDRAGPRLFMTEPSGAYAGYYGVAIGTGSQQALEVLEKNYRMDMKLEDAIKLALKSLATVIEGGLMPDKVELATVDIYARKFEKLAREQVEKYIASL